VRPHTFAAVTAVTERRRSERESVSSFVIVQERERERAVVESAITNNKTPATNISSIGSGRGVNR
jgi:hypothetical protein